MWGISWIAEELIAFQEGLCFVELLLDMFLYYPPHYARYINYIRGIHKIISPTQPNLLCVERGDMFRLTQAILRPSTDGRPEDGLCKPKRVASLNT
jgi:hypothetical protein